MVSHIRPTRSAAEVEHQVSHRGPYDLTAIRCGVPAERSQYLSGAGGLLPSMASISARTSGVNLPLSLSAERLSSSWLFFEAPRITVETFGLARHQSSAR